MLLCIGCMGAWAQTTWSHTDLGHAKKVVFRSYWMNTYYLNVNSAGTELKTTENQGTAFIIVEAETAGQYYLYEPSTKKYVGKTPNNATLTLTANYADAGKYSFVASTADNANGKDNTTPRFCIQCMNPINSNNVLFHCSGAEMAKSYGAASTTNYGGSAWHISSLEDATAEDMAPFTAPVFPTSGIYEIKNESTENSNNGRGYIVDYTTYTSGPSIGECTWNSGNPAYNTIHPAQRNDGTTTCSYWYIYNYGDGTYAIFSLSALSNISNARFMKVGTARGNKATYATDVEKSVIKASSGFSGKYTISNPTALSVYLSAACGTNSNNGAVQASDNASDGGVPFSFYGVKPCYLTAAQDNIRESGLNLIMENLATELQSKIGAALENIDANKIGFPVSEDQSVEALKGYTSVTKENYSEVAAAYQNVISCTNINLPQDGHMYVLTNIAGDANKTKHNLYESESGDKIKWSVYENLGSDGDKAKFICRKNGSNFTFVNAKTGHYLVWRGSDAGQNSYKGYTEAYDDTYARLNVQRAVYSASNMASATGQADLLGLVCICGKRPDYNAIDKCFIYSTTGSDNFNQTNNHTEYYSESLSTMFAIEEVDNPNLIKLTNPNKADDIAKKTLLDKRYVGTFSAPYAVQLSDEVEAYIASVSDNVVTFAKLGNDGHIVPKNTGVMLYAPEADNDITEVAVPAISTITIGNGTNVFEGSNAGSVVMQSGYYVLGKKEAGVGFYPAKEGSTLARNKAYLNLPTHLVSAFKFDFEDEGITTAISSALGLDQKNEGVAYDLAGRRCNIGAKGISIVGGKKVIR